MTYTPYWDELLCRLRANTVEVPAPVTYYGEDIHDEIGPASDDVMDQEDTISLEELEDDEQSHMSLAGIDELTPVDKFIGMNGSDVYVTDL